MKTKILVIFFNVDIFDVDLVEPFIRYPCFNSCMAKGKPSLPHPNKLIFFILFMLVTLVSTFSFIFAMIKNPRNPIAVY